MTPSRKCVALSTCFESWDLRKSYSLCLDVQRDNQWLNHHWFQKLCGTWNSLPPRTDTAPFWCTTAGLHLPVLGKKGQTASHPSFYRGNHETTYRLPIMENYRSKVQPIKHKQQDYVWFQNSFKGRPWCCVFTPLYMQLSGGFTVPDIRAAHLSNTMDVITLMQHVPPLLHACVGGSVSLLRNLRFVSKQASRIAMQAAHSFSLKLEGRATDTDMGSLAILQQSRLKNLHVSLFLSGKRQGPIIPILLS